MPKVVSDWTIAHVIEWAREIVDEEEAQKLVVQKVDGSALLNFTYQELTSAPIFMVAGAAKKLAVAIEKLRAPTGTP